MKESENNGCIGNPITNRLMAEQAVEQPVVEQQAVEQPVVEQPQGEGDGK